VILIRVWEDEECFDESTIHRAGKRIGRSRSQVEESGNRAEAEDFNIWKNVLLAADTFCALRKTQQRGANNSGAQPSRFSAGSVAHSKLRGDGKQIRIFGAT